MDTKICCLVLVHKNIHQVCRLCRQMDHPQINVFVHLDKKMCLKEEDLDKLFHAGNNIKILPERYSCYLDDWSLVEATLALLKYAKDYMQGEKKVYYALLSGQDYFIKPIQQFVDFLNDNYPQPYIDCTPYNVSNWIFPKFAHTKMAVWARKMNRFFKIRGCLFVACWLERLCPRMFFLDHKLQKYHIPLFGGSAWWVLPNVVVLEIFNFIDTNKKFVKDFSDCLTPEETFFQTMVMKSSLSDMVDLNFANDITQHCLTYAYFFADGKKFNGHPYCFVKDDFALIKSKKEYIARKFDETCDSEILDDIDDYIEHYEDYNNNNKL